MHLPNWLDDLAINGRLLVETWRHPREKKSRWLLVEPTPKRTVQPLDRGVHLEQYYSKIYNRL